MGGITLFAGRWLGRTLYTYASLCLAAFAMTLLRPAALWDAGFQLSFAATLGILLYVEPLSRRAQAILSRWTDEGRARRLARLLADGLTNAGVAVLRYDDRGTAESTGDFDSATTAHFADDAEAGLNYLLSRDEVDPDRTLRSAERARRAEHAKKAYFTRLALKSAQARRKR